jgi:hypothetical protein
LTAKLIVTYTEALDGGSGQQTGLAYEIGATFEPLQAPTHVGAHRIVENQGPDWVIVGPHPSPGRAFTIGPGQAITIQRQGPLFASTTPTPG